MYLELPEFTRCCFCLPLRLGVLTMAYSSLALSLLSVGVISYVMSCSDKPLRFFVHKGAILLYTNFICLLIVALLEAIFNIVLIVGIHKKKILLTKIYYYYGISTTLGTAVVNLGIVLSSRIFLVDFVMIFAGIVFHGYMVLLVRSEMMKLEASQSQRFPNRITDIVVSNQPRKDTQSLISDS